MTGPNSVWPLHSIVLRCGGVELRPVHEADVNDLARLIPTDVEHDPKEALFEGLSADENRQRLAFQMLWRHIGSWSPEHWALDLAAQRRDGELVGMQVLEGDDFPLLRTVDSASWLGTEFHGQKIGTAMRTAVLALAFDRLGAEAAISSADWDNYASLGVSYRVGYKDNGVSVIRTISGPVRLQHIRLTRDDWAAGGLGRTVEIEGLDGCAPYFGLAGFGLDAGSLAKDTP